MFFIPNLEIDDDIIRIFPSKFNSLLIIVRVLWDIVKKCGLTPLICPEMIGEKQKIEALISTIFFKFVPVDIEVFLEPHLPLKLITSISLPDQP